MSNVEVPLQVPIRPYDGSLAAQLAALDLLAARLALLPTRTRWPARIPLTSKASFVGELIHTNTLKVQLSGDWWVEMTAAEAADYITRRKNALLEYHANQIDGVKGSTSTQPVMRISAGHQERIDLDPIFHPALARSVDGTIENTSKSADTDAAENQGVSESGPATVRPLQNTPSVDAASERVESGASSSQLSSTGAPATSTGTPSAGQPKTLEDLVEQYMEQQRVLQASSAKAKGRALSDADETMVNEEGLPIHEIRENPDGSLIGAMPEASSTDAALEALPPSKDEDDDYWSEEAKQRRALLRRKIFMEGDDDDDDTSEDDESGTAATSVAEGSPAGAPNTAEQEKSRSPHPEQLVPPNRPSSLAVPSKSILKTPARKKSVSFDDSVPIPPDSPDGKSASRMSMGFPMPSSATNIAEDFEPRPIPLIAQPKPPVRDKHDHGFAGFKKGFLASTTAKQPTTDPGPTAAEPESKGRAKKPSLFAQRLASQAIKESAPPPKPSHAQASPSPKPTPPPNLPKMSDHQMSSMRSAVVENTPSLAKKATSAEDVQIIERNGASSSQISAAQPAGLRGLPARVRQGAAQVSQAAPNGSLAAREGVREAGEEDLVTLQEGYDDDEDDNDDDDDDDSFYNDLDDDEDEDEYDLDDALLAREVALEYHRRQAYTSMSSLRDPDADPNGIMGMDDDDEDNERGSGDEEEEEEEGATGDDDQDAGGVMLALPQVDDSGRPMIVNPTPDDVRRFLRVGRLENGNLVLAAGEKGWSDEEEDADHEGERNHDRQPNGQPSNPTDQSLLDDKAIRRARREEVKRQLLGQTPLVRRSTVAPQIPAPRQPEERTDLPPRIVREQERSSAGSAAGIKDVTERPAGMASGSTTQSEAAQPKKVSRFKQARMVP